MPKRRRKPRTSGRSSSRPGVRRATQQQERGLVEEIAEALATGEPLALLWYASSFLHWFDSRAHEEQSGPPLGDVLRSLLEVPLTECSALLLAVSSLLQDDDLTFRVLRNIAEREQTLPPWLLTLDQVRGHDQAAEVIDSLGDGDEVVFGGSFADGREFTLAVYVDHNLGTVVKDAFVSAGTVAELMADLSGVADEDPDAQVNELHPADARARLLAAIDRSHDTMRSIPTRTWPTCLPLLEWALRLLPEGGRDYRRLTWSDAEVRDLRKRFLASDHAVEFARIREFRDLLDELLRFGMEEGPGDPLHWSPVAVEMALVDWLPRNLLEDFEYLVEVPDLLRALIRFSHAERGIRDELTSETLAAVDAFEPEYLAEIYALPLDANLMLDSGVLGGNPLLARWGRHELQQSVGGAGALDELDTTPLPDEPFAWHRVPQDIQPRVAQILEWVDGCCADLLDVEHRTAARRLLAAVAEGDPRIFRRAGKAETAAAAICWLVAKSNRSVGAGQLPVKDLLAYFGPSMSSASQRAGVMLQAIGRHPGGSRELGSAAYLTGPRRRQIIELRDQLRDEIS